MTKRWVFAEEPEEAVVDVLKKEININPVLASILAHRGIRTFDAARSFFRPNLDELHDPFLMKNMARAVETIEKVISSHEKILIYGDYDVDGTTAVALFFGFLKPIYPNIGYYIPDRYTEGYGLSETGLQYAINNDFKLIITLDCGIKAVDLVTKGKSNGLEFIICDHHLPGEQLPPAVAVLDPKQKDCQYPFKELSGCFRLIRSIRVLLRSSFQERYRDDRIAASTSAWHRFCRAGARLGAARCWRNAVS